MDRRTLLKAALLGASATALQAAGAAAQERRPPRFQLKYAPHFGMFRAHAGDDLIDQLRFMRDEGFVALEDNGMPQRDVAVQDRIGAELERLGMQMGVFVAHADFRENTFVESPQSARPRIESDMRTAVEVAKRCNAKWCTVVPGTYSQKLEWDYQTANVIDNLRRAAEICEPHGLVMVLEPLNHRANHPGVFLTKISQAHMICRAVDSPSCKILDDLYHQQITEGNLIPNIDLAWDEIAYFQVGDNPGRKEPTTGEINYRNVFRHLHAKGFEGIVGMEHGNSKPGKEGERAVIDAYVQSDAF
jgi:hydroxypyruvate isomerase